MDRSKQDYSDFEESAFRFVPDEKIKAYEILLTFFKKVDFDLKFDVSHGVCNSELRPSFLDFEDLEIKKDKWIDSSIAGLKRGRERFGEEFDELMKQSTPEFKSVGEEETEIEE